MVYAKDLAFEESKNGVKVVMLFPGKYKFNRDGSSIAFYKKINDISLYQIINPQFVSFSGIKNPKDFIRPKTNNRYKDFLIKNKIDVLHVHSLIGLPKELIYEAKNLGVKVVFTTHDYYGLCPKINLFDYNNSICLDYNLGKKCIKCNYDSDDKEYLKRHLLIAHPLIFKFMLNVYKLFKRNKKIAENNNLVDNQLNTNGLDNGPDYVEFRNYYKNVLEQCDLVIFNSYITKETFSQYMDINSINYKVIPVTHSKIRDNRNTFKYIPVKDNKINFIYLGELSRKKGFFDLINVLEEIKKQYSNWQLHIYGDFSHLDIEKYDRNFYKFYGKYNHEDLPRIFSNASMIIIPSKWRETFGLIGLEAYSYGIPALVSENVGFSMIINENKNGIVYEESGDNIYLKKSIVEILEQPEKLKEINKEILKDVNFDNYLIENHTKQIIGCYKSLID
jgi:glycosyltransferase involved in cell wall biosynthesis